MSHESNPQPSTSKEGVDSSNDTDNAKDSEEPPIAKPPQQCCVWGPCTKCADKEKEKEEIAVNCNLVIDQISKELEVTKAKLTTAENKSCKQI